MKITKTTFDGLDAVELTTRDIRLIVVTAMGPRIALLSYKNSPNLFYWEKDKLRRGDWRIMGGSRVWVSRPMADEAEDTYAGDNQPCTVEESADVLTVTGGIDPFLKIQRGRSIRSTRDDAFEITVFAKNCGDMLYSAGLWVPTCINPEGGKEFGAPLGDERQAWDLATVIIPRKWGGHSSALNDPQFEFTKDCIKLIPAGVETKRMMLASLGIAGMSWQAKGISLLQHVGYDPDGIYPVDSNIAFYVAPGNLFVEMEVMGPQRGILPGETLSMTCTWILVDHPLDWNSAESILAALQK